MSEHKHGVPAGTPDADPGEPGEPEPEREPRARLFVAAWVPAEVIAVLDAFGRPEVRGVRWTTAEQWHVTLLFLGNVARSKVEELGTVLAAAITRTPGRPEARLGPATTRYGRSVLGVPVAGLDELAGAVRAALGVPLVERGRPFAGHLTLARAKGGRAVPASLLGAPLEARWSVGEVCLVRSDLDARGARYTTISRATIPP